MKLDTAHVGTWIGGVLAIAVAGLDLFVFHRLATDTDVIILAGGFGAFGVSIGYAVGQRTSNP